MPPRSSYPFVEPIPPLLDEVYAAFGAARMLWGSDYPNTSHREGYANGLIKFCVLYTYGWSDPLAGAGFLEARRRHFVVYSFPPASVWVYQ